MVQVKSKLNPQKFQPLFGDWWTKIAPFFCEGGLDPVFAHLKSRGKEGHKIAPISEHLFRCFRETALADLKLVIVAECPYHKQKDGETIADGMALSAAPKDYKTWNPPALNAFYNGIENELYDGMCLKGLKLNSLDYLAQQGVLLYNAALTTEIGVGNNPHQELWKPFSQFLFREIIDNTGVPILFLGKSAYLEESISPWTNFWKLPMPGDKLGDIWDTGNTLTQINEVLKANNNFKINWIDILPF